MSDMTTESWKNLCVSGMTPEERILAATEHYKKFCEAVGVDITRQDTIDTPKRIAKLFVNEFTRGNRPPTFNITTFAVEEGVSDQLVSVPGIRFSSLCRHHHLPIIGYAHVAYLPDKLLVGLSKLARIVKWYAGQPTVQEEMTAGLLATLKTALEPRWVGVQIISQHTCMSCRGVEDYESRTITTKLSCHEPEFHGTKEEFERAIALWYRTKGLL
jgi:GTP cyclohydrolase I